MNEFNLKKELKLALNMPNDVKKSAKLKKLHEDAFSSLNYYNMELSTLQTLLKALACQLKEMECSEQSDAIKMIVEKQNQILRRISDIADIIELSTDRK